MRRLATLSNKISNVPAINFVLIIYEAFWLELNVKLLARAMTTKEPATPTRICTITHQQLACFSGHRFDWEPMRMTHNMENAPRHAPKLASASATVCEALLGAACATHQAMNQVFQCCLTNAPSRDCEPLQEVS